ncbi:hypothetical protein BDW74DRAFT_175258 [Aspergillus multicolor]|uniref:ankyrin repeat domain-containing protein n=1 Tax=Aspergillus multicolor TaxID=41759 RepID=UPI003CCD2EB4
MAPKTNSMTPLLLAAIRGNKEQTFDDLILARAQGADLDINAPDIQGLTPLEAAGRTAFHSVLAGQGRVTYQPLDCAEAFIAHEVDVNLPPANPPLRAAIYSGYNVESMVSRLLEVEALDVNFKSFADATALTDAIRCNCAFALRILSDRPDIDVNKGQPLVRAIERGSYGIYVAEELIKKRPDLDVNKGQPLVKAIERGAAVVSVAKLLIETRPDLDVYKGQPLVKAIEQGAECVPVAQLLIETRPDLEVNKGQPLVTAIAKGAEWLPVGKLLLEERSDLDVNTGSPMELAILKGEFDLARMILATGRVDWNPYRLAMEALIVQNDRAASSFLRGLVKEMIHNGVSVWDIDVKTELAGLKEGCCRNIPRGPPTGVQAPASRRVSITSLCRIARHISTAATLNALAQSCRELHDAINPLLYRRFSDRMYAWIATTTDHTKVIRTLLRAQRKGVFAKDQCVRWVDVSEDAVPGQPVPRPIIIVVEPWMPFELRTNETGGFAVDRPARSPVSMNGRSGYMIIAANADATAASPASATAPVQFLAYFPAPPPIPAPVEDVLDTFLSVPTHDRKYGRDDGAGADAGRPRSHPSTRARGPGRERETENQQPRDSSSGSWWDSLIPSALRRSKYTSRQRFEQWTTPG